MNKQLPTSTDLTELKSELDRLRESIILSCMIYRNRQNKSVRLAKLDSKDLATITIN